MSKVKYSRARLKRSSVKPKNSLTNILLLKEFEQFLSKNNLQFSKEVVFSNIMPTKRQFRADYFILKMRIIIEINGGQYMTGRHNRGGKGYENDLVKSNLANINGFYYLQYTYQQLSKQLYVKDLRTIITKSYE